MMMILRYTNGGIYPGQVDIGVHESTTVSTLYIDGCLQLFEPYSCDHSLRVCQTSKLTNENTELKALDLEIANLQNLQVSLNSEPAGGLTLFATLFVCQTEEVDSKGIESNTKLYNSLSSHQHYQSYKMVCKF
ncbi:hypothetical protein POM88_054844 [Heracleum sosnowskyi]|uniref:Uncharacterized protein n=1 Tax=Heracleum sosnowskyi TaxID=360622 RepID=A0AAD8LUG8_9APIA|nr:hypothetical protein POM88_054844 [Heracleum sosnowskyi]